jgi:hypothetical protein
VAGRANRGKRGGAAELLQEFAQWVWREAEPGRLLHTGQREVFFDDTQLEVNGQQFEGAAINYNGDLAFSWQTLRVGPLLCDSHVATLGTRRVAGARRGSPQPQYRHGLTSTVLEKSPEQVLAEEVCPGKASSRGKLLRHFMMKFPAARPNSNLYRRTDPYLFLNAHGRWRDALLALGSHQDGYFLAASVRTISSISFIRFSNMSSCAAFIFRALISASFSSNF